MHDPIDFTLFFKLFTSRMECLLRYDLYFFSSDTTHIIVKITGGLCATLTDSQEPSLRFVSPVKLDMDESCYFLLFTPVTLHAFITFRHNCSWHVRPMPLTLKNRGVGFHRAHILVPQRVQYQR